MVSPSKMRADFDEGEIVRADLAQLSGQDAFFEIVTLKEGRFKFVQQDGPPEPGLHPIGGFMGMLMEGMQRIDDSEAE